MFRNYLAAALRNLVRNRLYTVINLAGLTVGFAAALLIALFVHDELSYDTWIPGHDRIYLVATEDTGPDGNTRVSPPTNPDFAAPLALDFPAIESIARLSFATEFSYLRRGEVEGQDMLFMADPNIFALLPMRVLAGDPATALDSPDGIVLTHKLARKYFGRDAPIGETIEINRTHPMRVTAVIADLPSRSHLRIDAIASGRAPFSRLAVTGAGVAPGKGIIGFNAFTYVRLPSPEAAAELQAALPAFVARHRTEEMQPRVPPNTSLQLFPLTKIHLSLPTPIVPLGGGFSPSGDMDTLYTFSLIGLLIVGVACVNFVNLMTARVGRRAVEIGIRKVSGAERRDLILQFIGEAFLYVVLAMGLAILAARELLPALNGLLDREIPAAALQALFAVLVALVCLTAIFAGFYPALVLSAFRPAAVLRAAKGDHPGMARLRASLVVLQFAVLIGLVLVAAISYRQMAFATRERLRLDTDQVLVISAYGPPPAYSGRPAAACRAPFRDSVAALPGVRAVSCSSGSASGGAGAVLSFQRADGTPFTLLMAAADFAFFDFYGLKPVAGRVFGRDHGDADVGDNPAAITVPAVINETAALKFGFGSAREAIGQVVAAPAGGFMGAKTEQLEIIGVVPDVSVDVHQPDRPAAYYMAQGRFDRLNVRLSGRDIPETLAAIDRLWREYGDPIPIPRRFLDDEIEARHRDITQQARVFAMFAGMAAFIAALGMFGLATFIAESRTKEIGVRKSLGASRGDILCMLVWQFAKPVLWANLIAWPAAYFVMRRWLERFVYRTEIEPWIFLATTAAALAIALLTVAGHALLVARAKPITALRYE